MIYSPSFYSRFGPQPTKYALAPFESVNSISLVDLLIQEGRAPIVKSLLELAREAQDEAMAESEDSEIEHYAYSLAWHYFCLQKCDEVDNLIENLKFALRRAEELKSVQEDLFRKFDCAMEKILDLQKYVVA